MLNKVEKLLFSQQNLFREWSLPFPIAMSIASLDPASFREEALRLARNGFVLIGVFTVTALQGGEPGGEIPARNDSQVLPRPVTEENFAAIKAHSPFLRTVGLSDSIVLTGVARIENDLVVTLLDTATTESHHVSKKANPQGWQLVDIRGDEADLESLTAKVQVAGGEVISIRYEKLPSKAIIGKPGSGSGGSSSRLSSDQLRQARDAAVNYRGEHPADGFPRLPTPEVVEKLSRMSLRQRELINRQMIELRNRGLGMDERRRIYVDMVDQTVRGR